MGNKRPKSLNMNFVSPCKRVTPSKMKLSSAFVKINMFI